MEMQMCSRCHKRMAVVFMTHTENGKTMQEGLCFQCARELGIKPVNDMLDKLGVTEEDLDRMSGDFNDAINSLIPHDPDDDSEKEDGGAPALDIQKIFETLGLQSPGEKENKNTQAANTSNSTKEKKTPKYKFLSGYCQNLTRKAAEGKMDRIIGRKRELARVIQILCRRQKNNPCLIGEPGVGKTAIAEALAQKIVAGDVPYALKEKELYLVDLTALVAGTQFRGQFESRILGLINDVKAAGNVILVIDEVHNLVGAGDAEGSMNAANIMKPALSRGEIQVIGATTLEEYRKYIEKDSALERRFQPVMVEEPSLDDSVEMLEGIKKYYENYHGVSVPEDIIRTAVTLSERYITDRYLPDKAIDLLDEALSHVSLSSDAINEKRKAEKELAAVQAARAQAEANPPKDDSKDGQYDYYKNLSELKVQEMQLAEKEKQLAQQCAALHLTVEDLADVIEIWTGIPASSISANEFSRLDGLEARLKEHIVGQDEAVSAVVRAVKRRRAGVSAHRAPISFIFAGPTGVGKTELVKVLAQDLFRQPESLIRLDMSEFMEKHSVSRIIGAPPGYVGYDQAGQLTEKIRRRPYSVVLFDEIEKAHLDVLNILLQILDDGRITDAQGKTVNFENTVIVMTTNAGSETSSSVAGFTESTESASKDKTEKALSRFLRPEFLNRVDEVITFRPLTEEDFVGIAGIMVEKMRKALAEKGIALVVTEDALRYIAQHSFSRKYGARNMRRYLEKNVEDPLAEEIISHYDRKMTEARVTLEDGFLSVRCM